MYCINHLEREGKGYCSKYNRRLCVDCMKCQDPSLYCKFRTACVVWELDRANRRAGGIGVKSTTEDYLKDGSREFRVQFGERGPAAMAPAGASILDAAYKADVFINATCGGKGVCGKCKVRVVKGDVERDESRDYHLSDAQIAAGRVLACSSRVESNLLVEIPDVSRYEKIRIAEAGADIAGKIIGDKQISPMVTNYLLELPPPSLDDPVSDFRRVTRELVRKGVEAHNITCDLEALQTLSGRLREQNWKATVAVSANGCQSEILRVLPGHESGCPWGLAIDVGTTTIVVFLVDLCDGRVAAISSNQNAQISCGDDVISRIIYASKPEGTERLHELVIDTVNDLIHDVCGAAEISPNEILSVAIAGNTVMTHSVLKLDPRAIRMEPYVPVSAAFPILSAADLGLKIHPRAGVYVLPGVAAYVGGDITAGALHSNIHNESPITLFIDVGTNGEVVIGNRDWMVAASCSTGPAFEGGGLKHGMRAMPGAIDRVDIDAATGEPKWSVIGDEPPRGICGSGVISLLAELFTKGFLAPNGKFVENRSPRIRKNDVCSEYVVVAAGESEFGEDIVLTEDDAQTLIQSKGAVYAGISCLLKSVGTDLNAIERVFIAGGFGKHLDIDHCVQIGMLPDIDRSKYSYLGNSSIQGAYRALIFRDAREEALEVSESMTYVDFSSSDLFFQEYRSALFFPHTHGNLFPSVKQSS